MKTYRKLRAGIVLFLMFSLILTSCSGQPRSKTSIWEDPGTSCEVRYAPYQGSYPSLFLSKGDRVAVISPSALPSKEQVDTTVKGLEKWGYVPVKGEHVLAETRSLDDCAEDLLWALSDPSIKAVFCVRGGYGASEVMDIIPQEQLTASSKLIIGYSDITVFHSAWTKAGLPSIHASMSAAFTDLPEECMDAEQKILEGEMPVYTCAAGSFCREGEAEGILIGGNLSTFTSVLDTAYDCTENGVPYILFFEDVEEDLQHIHRYLTILQHQGILDSAAGIIFGEWTDMPDDPNDYDGTSRGGAFTSVAEMISREILKDLDIPVAFSFPAGHGTMNYPLLMGEKAKLTVGPDQYTLTWPG